MTDSEIHAIILPAVRDAAGKGATAKDLKRYLIRAVEGMKVCASFDMDGPSLLDALRHEDMER